MDFVISQPELSIEPSKSIFVVRPVSVEVFGAVEAFLKNYPPPSVCSLVTKDMEWTLVIWVDEIDAILFETLLKEVDAVTSWEIKKLTEYKLGILPKCFFFCCKNAVFLSYFLTNNIIT